MILTTTTNYYMLNFIRLSIVGIVIGVTAFSWTPDYLRIVVSSACSVIMGLVIRLAADWKDGNLTVKRCIIQSAFSMGIGYLTFFLLEGAGVLGMKRQFILALCSFLASHLVAALDAVGGEQSKNMVQVLFDKLLEGFSSVIAYLVKKKENEKKKE